MTAGLAWVRRRLPALARGVLALLLAASLQVALVPCAVAHDGGQATHHDGGTAHCVYCPPGAAHGSDGDCDGGDCAYPHEPQADARAAGTLLAALPVAFVVPVAAPADAPSGRGEHPVAGAVPKVSLSITYCRFIE